MNSILNVSLRTFTKHELAWGTVGELNSLLMAIPGKTLVVTIQATYRSTAVISPSALNILSQAQLHSESSLIETGLWDVLRAGQMSVSAEMSAQQIFGMVWLGPVRIGWITVLDGERTPVGIVKPTALIHALPYAEPVMSTEMHLEMSRLAIRADLPGMLRLLDTYIADFHSEHVNLYRPVLYECDDHGQTHDTDGNPCPSHGLPTRQILID
jgi:hypothetical protein